MENIEKNEFKSIFATQIRVLTDDELKHVSGGEFTENDSGKPSQIKIDQAGMFQ
jgi:bacteriocin-like protein